MLRNSLHPEGLAPRIANLGEWRAHLLARLRRQIDLTGDPVLVGLQRELHAYPPSDSEDVLTESSEAGVVVSLRFVSPAGALNLNSTTMVFGTPLDVTVSELALETFFPADSATASLRRRLAEERASSGPTDGRPGG